MSAFKWDTPTKTSHRTSYPSISPSRPELSQAGKTVLVTGGSAGIGYAIARSFVQAHAGKLIILGRRPTAVSKAVSSLSTLASSLGSPTTVIGLECDMGSPVDTALLWGKFAGEGTVLDVLVLNAASIPPMKPATSGTAMPPVFPLLEVGADLWTKHYDVNVRAQIDWAGRFYSQQGKGVGETKVRYLIYKRQFSYQTSARLTHIAVPNPRLNNGDPPMGHQPSARVRPNQERGCGRDPDDRAGRIARSDASD